MQIRNGKYSHVCLGGEIQREIDGYVDMWIRGKAFRENEAIRMSHSIKRSLSIYSPPTTVQQPSRKL